MEHVKNVKSVTVAALLVAPAVTLKFLRIAITPTLEFSFAFPVNASADFLSGPFMIGTVGALSGLFGYVVCPMGPFLLGFTLSAIINGAVCDLISYRKPVLMQCAVIARPINTVLISFLLNSTWLSMMYGKALYFLAETRLIEAVILFVPECILLYMILKLVKRIAGDSALSPQESVS